MSSSPPTNPSRGVCGTDHPDPSRLLSLGDAAKRTRTPLLHLRAAIREGRLRTLPALHLGQPIRLVEPDDLRAAFPQAILAKGPVLDPIARGINWIGTEQGEAPPGVAPLSIQVEAPPVSPAAASPSPGPRPQPPEVKPAPAPGPHVDRPRPAPTDAPMPPERPAACEGQVPAVIGKDEPLDAPRLDVKPMGGRAPAPVRGGDRLATLFCKDESPEDGEGPNPAGETFEGGRFSGQPLLGHQATDRGQAVQLGLDVKRFETRRVARSVGLQLVLVVGSGLLVSAWMFYASDPLREVLASDSSSVEQDLEFFDTGSWDSVEAFVPPAPVAPEGGKDEVDAPPQKPVIPGVQPELQLAPEDAVPADPADDLKVSLASGSAVLTPTLATAQVQATEDAPIPALPPGLESPAATGPACSWWTVTQPGGPLRELLGPCKGPWNAQDSVVVGLHRYRGIYSCSHHLAFLRDRGGDLARESGAAEAARHEGWPSPLMAQRVEGAARRMLRDRLGTWAESGFEAGGDHSLTRLSHGVWQVDSWVRAYEQGRAQQLERFVIELKLSDGPHRDQEISFSWGSGKGSEHR